MFQKIFLCVIAVLLAYPTNAQYQDVFDRVIRSKFNIQTNRRLDLDELNPYNVERVIQEGQFLFLIGNEKGVFTNYPDDEYMNAPDDPRFEQCLRLVAKLYQKDVIYPYIIPVIIQYHKLSGIAGCWDRLYGIIDGESSTWAGVSINSDIYNNYDIHYVLEEGDTYNGLYLTEIIAHEIFHSFSKLVFYGHKEYPYSWTKDGSEEYEEGRYRPYADDLGLVSFFYNGENAMKANGGQLIQGYGDHFSNAFQETDDKFFTVNYRIHKAINHLGPVSLGIMKDAGFELKEGVSFERDEFTGYLFDENEQAYGWVSMGDTIYFDPEDVSYGLGPVRPNYPLNNEEIEVKENFSLYAKEGVLYIENYDAIDPIIVCDITGHVVTNKKFPIGTNTVPVKETGVYIVKKGGYSKKIFCP